jgi:hypothetical protein
MAPGRARGDREEQEWRRWISRWQASGLSARAFCARHGLHPANFYAWRRTLQRRADPPTPDLVPVQLLADAAPDRLLFWIVPRAKQAPQGGSMSVWGRTKG